MQINHTILLNVNVIKKILDYWVCWCFLARHVMELLDKLAKVCKCDAAIFVNIKLNI